MTADTDTDAVLSVIMPAYNEAGTVGTILQHVLRRPEVRDVIVVDDGSVDGTWDVLCRFAEADRRVRAIRQPCNQGKGAAVRAAIPHLTAPFTLIQDADLELDPDDFPLLLEPLVSGRADAVNGVRGFRSHAAYSYWFVKGNHWLTTAANIIFDCRISDLLSGYKVLRTDLWQRLNLRSQGFEVETEIVAKVVRLGYRFHEVPITYITRSRAEGKKIRARDGLRIVGALARVRLLPLRRLFDEQDWGYHRLRQEELGRHRPFVRRLGMRPPS